MSRNISDSEDRSTAEAERESERQWREVFEHNPAMLFMVDATGGILSVNAVGASQLGYAASALVGQSALTLVLEEDKELVRRKMAMCLETPGQSNSWEARKLRKDGAVRWIRENAKAMQ